MEFSNKVEVNTQSWRQNKNGIVTLISALYITMFLYAAVSKWLIFPVFKLQMARQPLNEYVRSSLVWIIPLTEIAISILLMITKTRWWGMICATGLMMLFTGYIILIKAHLFTNVPCSCGGVINNFTWTQHLYFNLVFVFIGCFSILLDRKPQNFN